MKKTLNQHYVYNGKFIGQTFHVVGHVRARASWKFIDASCGGVPLRLRTTDLIHIHKTNYYVTARHSQMAGDDSNSLKPVRCAIQELFKHDKII